MPLRIPEPPSAVTGALRVYLMDLVRTLNTSVPACSYFSGATPESVVTGVAGDFAIQVGSASTNTRIWTKAGSPTVASTTSWMKMAVL